MNLDPHTLVGAVSIAMGGIAIAAACGLRAFLPLLVLGLANHFGIVRLDEHAAWLGSVPVLATLAVAAVFEILADKIPVVDHVLDVAATFVRPAAAAVAGWATFAQLPPVLSFAAALILGAGALGVHVLKAKTRIGSTALTLGHANPVISTGEDVTAGLLSGLGILVPILAGLLVIGLVWLGVRGLRPKR